MTEKTKPYHCTIFCAECDEEHIVDADSQEELMQMLAVGVMAKAIPPQKMVLQGPKGYIATMQAFDKTNPEDMAKFEALQAQLGDELETSEFLDNLESEAEQAMAEKQRHGITIH